MKKMNKLIVCLTFALMIITMFAGCALTTTF